MQSVSDPGVGELAAAQPHGPMISLRAAEPGDARLLWEWANDPAVRSASFNSAPIALETHVAWYAERLADPGTAFFLAHVDSDPVGYARVETIGPGLGEIALSVDAAHRGRGYGAQLAALAADRAASELGVTRIVAQVKAGNEVSTRSFVRGGFAELTTRDAGDIVLMWPGRGVLVPHSRPYVGAEEAEAAGAAILSRSLAAGTRVRELERTWAEAVSMPFAVCVGSGLAALRLALLSLGVGPGDEVLVPAYSCVALLNAPLSLGAEPVLVDVIEDEWTIDPTDVERRASARTRAIVGVNLFGAPLRMKALRAFGIPVVEDCAHGIGGSTDAGPFGAGGDASIASFYATKMLGAGEGGAVAVRDEGVAAQIRSARDYGDQLPNPSHLNDKMTDVEAAVALVQLAKLEEMLRLREEAARRYDSLLQPLVDAGRLVLPKTVSGRIWYRYCVRLVDRDASAISDRMSNAGVNAEQPVWDLRAAPQWTDGLTATGTAFSCVLSLPLFPDLSEREAHLVVASLHDALHAA